MLIVGVDFGTTNVRVATWITKIPMIRRVLAPSGLMIPEQCRRSLRFSGIRAGMFRLSWVRRRTIWRTVRMFW